MIHIFTNLLFILIYISLLATVVNYLKNRFINKLFPMLNTGALTTVLLAIPIVLLISLNEGIDDLSKLSIVAELDLVSKFSKYALMLLSHLGLTLVGLLMLIISAKIFYAKTPLETEHFEIFLTLGMLILAVSIGVILNMYLGTIFNEILPSVGVKGFN